MNVYYKCYECVSEETDVNKASVSKKCDICHYWYLLNYSFTF